MKWHAVLLSLVVLSLLAPQPGEAIPAFARKTGFNCMMCHTAYPKLNDWGQRFRDNGYQLPGQAGQEKTVFDSPPPISLRTSNGLNAYAGKRDSQSGHVTTAGFDLNGLDLLAAGPFHKNVSALLIYTPRLDEPTAGYRSTDASQPGALESASLVFSNLVPDILNLRVGRFEPAYHLFSSKRSYYLLESYEAYNFTSPASGFSFGDNQTGIEATGHARIGCKYAMGIVNGTGPRPDNDKFKDLYLAVSQTFGPGDGQSAGQRIGAFFYYGKQPTATGDSVSTPSSPTGQGALGRDKPFHRYGGAVSLNWRTFNLGAMYLRGSDDKTFNVFDPEKSYTYQGGFVELDYAGLWNNRLVGSGLFNWVTPPSADTANPKTTAYSALVRYYLGDWSAFNVALHGEYTYRRQKVAGETTREHIFSALVDFAF